MTIPRKVSASRLLACLLCLSFYQMPPALAAEKGEVFVSTLFKQLGVKADDMPESVMVTVEDPEKLIGFGLKGVVRGDGVELTDLGDGKIKVRHVPTDDAIELRVK